MSLNIGANILDTFGMADIGDIDTKKMADADTKILYYGNKNMREQLTDLFVDANVWACTGFEILLQALDVSLPYIWTSIIFKIPSSNMGLCLH